MNESKLSVILSDETLSEESKDKLKAMHLDISGKEFSDLLDAEGNQYVEFVQEGGGVWGTALVGYLYGLEIFGVRFLKVAGTSAGAINTMLIASCKKKEDAKSEVIKDILFNWDFSDFMDGKEFVKSFVHSVINNENYVRNNLILGGIIMLILVIAPFAIPTGSILYTRLLFLIPIIPIIILFLYIRKLYKLFQRNNIGLNPGNAFLNRMTDVLHAFGIDTVAQLNEKFKAREKDLNLNYRYGNTSEYYNIALENIRKIKEIHKEHLDETRFKLFYDSAVNNDYYKTNPFYLLKSEYVVIATDIATKIKVEFPRMSNLYWSEEELKQTSPSHFVRASMSVPFFFEPMQKNIDATQESVKYAWRYWLNTSRENICPTGIFIDGGSISNFPVDLFHNNDIFYPRLPVFGVKLTSDLDILTDKGCSSKEVLRTPLSFSGNIINTLKGFNDKTFLTKYSFYDLYSIQTVNCGKSNWLNFFMKKEEKEDLFNRGFQSALDFLSKFDWEKYKYERMMVSMKDKKIMKEMDTPTVG